MPVHSATRWYYFGGITLFLFGIQVMTGILLMLYYRPTVAESFDSVRFIMTRDPNNRVTPQAPQGYQREDFLPVLETLKLGQIKSVFGYPRGCIFKAHLPPLPNDKYRACIADIHNNGSHVLGVINDMLDLS